MVEFIRMKPIAFEGLARLPLVSYYERAFRKATGVSLKLVPPPPEGVRHFGVQENAFCALAAATPAGCTACIETEARAVRNVATHRRLQQLHCYAGLTVVGCPVMIGGHHVATLLSGQILRREPTERDFLMVSRMIGEGLGSDWERAARKAYFETPVLDAERFEAVRQLLELFAQHLAESGSRLVLETAEAEPKPVTHAKQFVQQHVEEPITLAQVLAHVHISRFYFCKLFKKATGMTLTEYIARVRVERAKSLLRDPSQRISEVVFAAGFGSIPQFNSVFKRHVGMAPSHYRASLRAS